jgi:hypothetical protein
MFLNQSFRDTILVGQETRRFEMLTLDKIKFDIIVHPEEEIPVRGNAIDSGNPEADRLVEDRILQDLRSNAWAWCQVEVRGTVGSLTASDYLGCCNYSDQDDFKNGGYYDDMLENVRAELEKQVMEVWRIAGLEMDWQSS